jgi:hypothetical protein
MDTNAALERHLRNLMAMVLTGGVLIYVFCEAMVRSGR